MTTIREELYEVGYNILEALGIDPDLPAEWATVDRCLTWLWGRDWWVAGPHPDGEVRVVQNGMNPVLCIDVLEPTYHAALIAACTAVSESTA